MLKNIRLKHPTSSGGTVPKSTADVIGSNTFFAPESKQTCNVLAKFATFATVPLTLISQSTASELTVGFWIAIEHNAIKVGKDNLSVMPIPCRS